MELLIDSFESRLRALAPEAEEIRIVIAFLTEGGIRWLPKEKFEVCQAIVGINLGLTTPAAILMLKTGGADVRIFHEPNKLFHPKAAYFQNEESEHLIIGSNNLTSAGVARNHELGILVKRDSHSEELFRDFLAYFDALKHHACCGIPSDEFFHSYQPQSIRTTIDAHLTGEKYAPGLERPHDSPTPLPGGSTALSDFLGMLAEEFPKLERKRGAHIADHPLKKLHDEEFRPLFDRIIEDVSDGRLKPESSLNIGGNWYRIPLIRAHSVADDPWSRVDHDGVLALQVHFSEDYRFVMLSVVLQFLGNGSSQPVDMPTLVANRFDRALSQLQSYSERAAIAKPVFHYFEYKGRHYWSKPIITIEYNVGSLPPDQILANDLAQLSIALNGALAIR
jgi:hypothetical protein